MSLKNIKIPVIFVFLGISGLGLVFGLVAVFFFWLILRRIGFETDYWAMVEALSTAVAAAAVLGAAFVAQKELSESSSSRHLEVANELFEELNSPRNIEARRWVYQNLPENPEEGLAALTPEGHEAVKRVLNSLDHVAFLTQSGWIPEDLVMPWMNPMILKSWYKLRPYVMYERTRRNEIYYYQYAEKLAERCLAWRKNHDPQHADVLWKNDAL